MSPHPSRRAMKTLFTFARRTTWGSQCNELTPDLKDSGVDPEGPRLVGPEQLEGPKQQGHAVPAVRRYKLSTYYTPGAGDTAASDRAPARISPHSLNELANDDYIKGRRWLGAGSCG